ncbi:MAG: bacterial Ig-like domain-containing protein [Corallococcus sp.]|nr:bacterial Ig-like domain-containing protein [Corallococcus sp.]MCM1360050.1 bacterial Ig-like domain-containing protein [Corallococcus sp.]MCM1395607.1 bacterial Ig-like domain-containing protein [Corallococcus sp.]
MNIKNKFIFCAMLFTVVLCCLALTACSLFGAATVNFDPNYDGAAVDVHGYGAFESRKVPSAPERSGYKFDGWFADKDGTKPLTQGMLDDAKDGATFYAKWTALPKSLNATYSGDALYTGDALNKSDFEVAVTYYDDKTISLSEHKFTVDGYDPQTAGEQTLTVSYAENGTTVSCRLVVEVNQLVLENLAVAVNPNRTVCVGDAFSSNMLIVVAGYNNGKEVDLTYGSGKDTDYAVQGFNTDTAGSVTLTVSFGGKTKQVTVNVEPVALTRIEAQYVGSSVPVGLTLDKEDFAVTAHYNNGTYSNVKYPAYSVGAFAAEEVGEVTVTVSYTENGVAKSCDVTVGVVDAIVTSLTVAENSRTINTGDEIYESLGIFVGDAYSTDLFTVTALYSDGTSNTPSDFSVAGFDTSAAGNISVTFFYNGATLTQTVVVQEVTLLGISAVHDGTVFIKGSTFRPSTITVYAWYSNGSKEKLSPVGDKDGGYKRSGFSTTKAGEVFGTVTHKGFSKDVYYTVVEGGITGVEAYYIGETIYDGDTLLNDSLQVLLVYDGTTKRATTDFIVSGYDSQSVGQQTLTVICAEDSNLTATVQIAVVRRTVTDIQAVYDGTVNKGEKLDTGKLTVTLTFNNGTSEVVSAPAVGTINTDTVGVKQLQVSCDWYGQTPETTVNITVLDPATVMGDNLSIHFLELGNIYAGDCTYIKAGDTDILIDAGSRASSAETIDNYISQFCTDGVLEYVIATHAHQDHIEGFVGSSSTAGIFERYECENIIDFNGTNQGLTTKTGKDTLYAKYLKARDAEVAEGANRYSALDCVNNINGAQKVYNLTEDGSVTMEILYQEFYEKTTGNENNYSVCLMIKQGNNNYLFTGDLEDAGEASLVKYNPNLPNVVLYKGGHHGSYTAASEEFLQKIQPQNVCICCCAGSVEYTQNQDNVFPAQDFINRVAVYTENVYVTSVAQTHQDTNGKWVNDGYSSMNGNIVVTCQNGRVVVRGSNNSIKLKDTDWFASHRTMPSQWKNGTSIYR